MGKLNLKWVLAVVVCLFITACVVWWYDHDSLIVEIATEKQKALDKEVDVVRLSFEKDQLRKEVIKLNDSIASISTAIGNSKSKTVIIQSKANEKISAIDRVPGDKLSDAFSDRYGDRKVK